MKAGTVNTMGTRTQAYQSPSSNSSSTTNVTARSVVITRGPNVRGDFHSPNAWSYLVRDVTHPEGSEVITRYTAALQWQETITTTGVLASDFNLHAAPGLNMPLAYENALARLNENVRGGLDLSVALLEMSSTARMIRAVGRWNRWFKGFGPKRWANEWLQYRYGWVPLLSDIHSVAKEVTRQADNKLVFRGSSRADATMPKGFPNPFQPTLKYDPDVTYLKAGVRYKVKLTVPSSKTDIARWTSLNPVSIAWELLPYSFVADWFIDLGGWLRNVETAISYGSVFEHGYVEELIAYTVRHDCAYKSSSPRLVVSQQGLAKSRYISYNRTKLWTYPLPRAPVLKVDLSWKQLVSAGALLYQQFSR